MADAVQVSGLVSGAEDVAQGLMDVPSLMLQRILVALDGAGKDIETVARGRAPVRTGKLQRSIKARVKWNRNGAALTVRPGKFYARFVEFGTLDHRALGNGTLANKRLQRFSKSMTHRHRVAGNFRQAPQPFMGPAREATRARIEKSLEQAVSDAVTEV